ncbi:hypothetical protein LX64_02293 [Chitinophaga skermanii]|uniref:Membrane protein DUF2157 n=1 Tax=Chitinophaga skermanii TaxID=331697 RepID=A0A327QKS3_9BACT|nr:hypothetical protein [Chitinophaga skermanii]RAJ05139.1 hypothetical protein LX64_02293 [Chitinophaga skermanii]
MIAYNKEQLDNFMIQEAAEAVKEKGLISQEEWEAIQAKHPVKLYTPNIFVRIGLALAVIIGALLVNGLFLLMGTDLLRAASSVAGIEFFLGIVCYFLLELYTHAKPHYFSGIDDGLIIVTGGMMITGFILMEMNPTGVTFLTMFMSIIFFVRFPLRWLGVFTYGSILAFVFAFLVNVIPAPALVLSIVIFILSLATFMLTRKVITQYRFRYYSEPISWVSYAALLSLYASVNYFVVREIGGNMMALEPGEALPLGWFFWITTCVVPLIYIYLGITKKSRVCLVTGLTLVAATVYTVRQYYYLLPVESVMCIAGFVMVGIAALLLRYLKTPKHGFTTSEEHIDHSKEKSILESLIIAQTMSAPQTPTDTGGFGGGSTIGGGAGGDY